MGESRREQLPPSAYRHRASRRLYMCHIGLWRGDAALPFEPLAAGRARPALPEVARFVADHLHRAAVLVDAVACGPQACLLVIVALTVPAGGVSPPGAKRHSSRTGA